MAELSLRERLQPSLLDRLVDEQRFATIYRITAEGERLRALGITAADITGLMRLHGLKPLQEEPQPSDSGGVALEFIGYGYALGPGQLRALAVTPRGGRGTMQLQSFCKVESRTSLNTQTNTAGESAISMRRLRECVHRDLGWLLKANNLEATDDLGPYPYVCDSVVNFGMPSFAGLASSSIDPADAAARIASAIRRFEPRLSRVQVTPESGGKLEEFKLRFRIEAELWGQPVPQQIALLTSIDVGTGNVSLQDATSR
jgi:type VI secretion system protein ImpF